MLIFSPILYTGIDCFMPENGETSIIKTQHNIPLDTSLRLLKRQLIPADG